MKLGIIGAGMIVNEFLTITEKLKGLELTAIFGRKNKAEVLDKLKKEYGIKNIFYDYVCGADSLCNFALWYT